jgi:hypothetical protein
MANLYYIATFPVWASIGAVWIVATALQTAAFEALLAMNIVDEKWR